MPNKEKARVDLVPFYIKLAETYFRICREEVKRIAPNHLYLGCRFCGGGKNANASRAAAKYCDIISINIYAYRSDEFIRTYIPPDVDKPIIIGEFMCGAYDRGMFHPSHVPTLNQEDRALEYWYYVRSALSHPLIVGTHWFKYQDYPVSGSAGFGGNYQCGFLDICDTPYIETINTCRKVGYRLYEIRMLRGAW